MPTWFAAEVASLLIEWGATAEVAYYAAAVAYAAATVAVYASEAFILTKAEEALKPSVPRGLGRGLDIQLNDTGAPGFAICGRIRATGVNVIPAITGGNNGEYLEQILALAIHGIDGFEGSSLDDTEIPDSIITAVTGTSNDGKVTAGKYSNQLWVRRYTGTATQAVDFILNSRYPSAFTSDYRGRGTTYAANTFHFGDGKLYTGAPNMLYTMRGAKVYDPRLDSTNGGSGSHRYNDSTTWQFTNNAVEIGANPALLWAWFLMASFGGRVDPATGINWVSVAAAANACDGSVVVPYSPFSTFVNTANATNDGINFYRLAAGGSSWAYGTYSTDGHLTVDLSTSVYTGGGVSGDSVFGLHTSATFAAGSPSVDVTTAYAIHISQATNTVYFLEQGAVVLTVSRTIANTDRFRIRYDGTYIRYFINDVLYRTVSVATPGQFLYLNASGYQQGAGVSAITTKARYTFNGRLDVTQDWRDNAKYFIDAMLGRMVKRGRTWFVYAGAWTAPSFSVAKLDWMSIDSIKSVQTREGGRWNTCRCWYVDPNRNWQREECYPRRNATYKSSDGGDEITLPMEQYHCTNEYEAQRKAEFMLRRSRNQIMLVGSLPPRFRFIAAGDVGAFTFEEAGWVSKTMRVVTCELLQSGAVKVGLAEEQAADWNDLLVSEYNQPSTSPLPLPNPTTPTAPSAFNVVNNINGTLTFAIGEPIVKPNGTRYQVIRGNVSNDATAGTVIYDGLLTQLDITCPTSTQYYWARAYANSYYGPYLPNTSGVAATATGIDQGQIQNGAVSQTLTVTDASTTAWFADTTLADTAILSIGVQTSGGSVGIDAQVNFSIGWPNGSHVSLLQFMIYKDGSQLSGSMIVDMSSVPSSAANYVGTAYLGAVDAPTAAVHTYSVHILSQGNWSGSFKAAGWRSGQYLKLRQYTR